MNRPHVVFDRSSVKAAIRAKITALAKVNDIDATGIADEDVIPATGYLDSTGILELVVWFDSTYQLGLKQEEINIDNLGSIDAMAGFLLSRKAGAEAS